jgi:hypothetical protein
MMDYNDELKAIWNSKPEHREITCKVCRYDFDSESYERHAKICRLEDPYTTRWLDVQYEREGLK